VRGQISQPWWSTVCSLALGALAGCGDSGPEQQEPDATTIRVPDASTGVMSADPIQQGGAPPEDGSAPTDAGNLQAVDTGPPDLGENSGGDSFFRTDTLVLKSPNLYAKVLIVTAQVTADAQNALNDSLTMDGDADGFVDLSLLLRFIGSVEPQTATIGQLTPGGARCPLPLAYESACGPEETFPFQRPAVMFANGFEACALDGTMQSAPPPCFATTPASLTMQLPILGAVPLQDGQVVGTWESANIQNGWVRGFLPKAIAKATKLGDGLPSWLALAGVKAGAPLTDFLSESEIQTNSQGEEGWWFLMSFTAKAAAFNPALSQSPSP
jgi:hypothetical protein